MGDIKGTSWFKMDGILFLMIADTCKDLPYFYTKIYDYIICSNDILQRFGEQLEKSQAKIILVEK